MEEEEEEEGLEASRWERSILPPPWQVLRPWVRRRFPQAQLRLQLLPQYCSFLVQLEEG